MSANSIPNLLSLRGGRGGRSGGGRGSGHGPRRHNPNQDEIVQGTDTDAAVSRMSAVALDYLEDPFAQYFVTPTAGLGRRLPIINRGTYTRTTALDHLVYSFLSGDDGRPKQIISLGAGTDTRALRILSDPRWSATEIIYHEIDFPSIAARKLKICQNTPAVIAVLGDITVSSPSLHSNTDIFPPKNTIPSFPPPPSPPPPGRLGGRQSSQITTPGEAEEQELSLQTNQASSSGKTPTYWTSHPRTANPNSTFTFHGLDIRTLTTSSSSSSPPTKLANLDPNIPTLLLSECCLCYLPPSICTSTITFFTNLISNLALVLYEPIGPTDPFGQMMVSNLAARGIHMPTLAIYPSVAHQKERFVEAGFDAVRARTVRDVWDDDAWVMEKEKERLDGLEGGLDEVEEWHLLAGHYVVAWGWRGAGFEGWEDGQPKRGRAGQRREEEREERER